MVEDVLSDKSPISQKTVMSVINSHRNLVLYDIFFARQQFKRHQYDVIRESQPYRQAE